jgi:hypothetical protein
MSDYIVLTKRDIAKLLKATAKAETTTDALIATLGCILGGAEVPAVRAKPGRKPGRKPKTIAAASPSPAADLT